MDGGQIGECGNRGTLQEAAVVGQVSDDEGFEPQ